MIMNWLGFSVESLIAEFIGSILDWILVLVADFLGVDPIE